MENTQAKEYPPKMSKSIAQSMCDSATQAPCQGPAPDIDAALAEYLPYTPPLDPYAESGEFGADFVDPLLPIYRFKAKWQPPTVQPQLLSCL